MPDEFLEPAEQLRVAGRQGGQRLVVVEMGLADAEEVLRRDGAAHVVLEGSLQPVADVGEVFFMRWTWAFGRNLRVSEASS